MTKEELLEICSQVQDKDFEEVKSLLGGSRRKEEEPEKKAPGVLDNCKWNEEKKCWVSKDGKHRYDYAGVELLEPQLCENFSDVAKLCHNNI